MKLNFRSDWAVLTTDFFGEPLELLLVTSSVTGGILQVHVIREKLNTFHFCHSPGQYPSLTFV
jgi:hypothetical protein